MEQCSGEFIFLALVAVPTLAALVAWILKHTLSADSGADVAPINYWGAYHTDQPAAHLKGIPLPATPYEEIESASHIHTITVHP